MGLFDFVDKVLDYIDDTDENEYEKGDSLGDSGFKCDDYVKFKSFVTYYYTYDNEFHSMTNSVKTHIYMAQGISPRTKRVELYDVVNDIIIKADPGQIEKCSKSEIDKFLNSKSSKSVSNNTSANNNSANNNSTNNNSTNNNSTPKSETYTPSNFKIGDVVRFKNDATTYYDAKSGAKISMSVSIKEDTWRIIQFDLNNNKMVILLSMSDANYRIKAKVSSLSFVSNATAESPSQAALKIGSLVRFKDDATVFYDARNNTQFYIDEYLKKEIWYIDHFDFKNTKIVVLQSKSNINYKIKANTADICLVGDKTSTPNKQNNMVNQQNSTVQSTEKEKTMINNNYNGYQFTALGLSGSGKTCFMAGMYYKMSGGVSGYTLKAGDDDSVNLTAYYEQMMNSDSGADRFPGGTNQSSDYSFELQYGYKTLEKFRWIDYAGGTLKNKNTGDAEEYQQLKNDIAKSEMLYIFVDGGLFQDEDVEYAPNDSAKIDTLTDIIMDNCSRQINHFLSEYANERKKLPPIAIVVTKYDLAVKALGKTNNEENMQMLYKIIQKAFNPLFPDPNVYMGDDSYASMVGIIPVSLGMKISDGGYKGRLRPINMHLPAYVGIWFMLKNAHNNQDTPINRLADEIEDSGVKFWLNGQSGKFSTLADGYLKKIKEVR